MIRIIRILLLAGAVAAAGCGGPSRKDGDAAANRSDVTNRARVHTELAAAYHANGQMSVALEEAREALAADPNYGPAHNQLGVTYMALGEDKLARQAFERALKIDPNDSVANNNYGMFLCQRKPDKEAFKYFMTALKNPLYTTPEDAYTNAGICAWLQGDDARADEWLRKAIALQPNQTQALYYLAEVSFKRDDLKGARVFLTRHLQRAQPTANALWLGVRIEGRLGDRNALASYGAQLNNRFPNAAQTQAFNAGKYQ